MKNDDTKPYIKENIKSLNEEYWMMKSGIGKTSHVSSDYYYFEENASEKPAEDEKPSTKEINQEHIGETKDVIERASKKDEVKNLFLSGLMNSVPAVDWKDIVGNGKKSLAKAVAKEAGASFFGISAAKFISKWDGNNEDKVKTLFATARANRPAIIFIDEIEDITWAARGPQSEIASKVKIEIILQFYEGDYTGLFVVIATSFPWDIDAAIRKRLELRIYVPLPDCKEREELIKAMLKGAESSVNDEEIKELSEWTEGFSRSDLSSLVRDARFEIFRRLQKTSYFKQAGTNLEGEPIFTTCDPDVEGSTKLSAEELKPGQIQLNPTSMEDFLTVLKTIKPATFPTDVQKHEKFREDFGNRSLDGSLL